MDTSALVYGLRALVALGVVLGVMWVLARRAKGGVGGGLLPRRRTAPITVVGRQTLGGRAGVAVVEVDGRRLLLGVAEQGVTLLTELAPAPDVAAEPRVERVPLDPAELDALTRAETGSGLHLVEAVPAHDVDLPSPATDLPLTAPAARMPAVPMPRTHLEGSILAPATWRQAMVAVQERTIRR